MIPDGADPAIAEMAATLRALAGKLHRRLREQSLPGGLTWSQLAVLGQIEREGPTTCTALAKVEKMRTQSMGAITAALEEQGLVASAADPRDARRTLLSLTPAGRAWIRDSRAAREDWLVRIMHERFSPAEQQALGRGIELIKRLVD